MNTTSTKRSNLSAPRRNRQRGNALVVSMIALTGLATLGSVTAVSVQGGMASASVDRFHTVALYAAESGGAAAMEYLRLNVNVDTRFSDLMSANNATPSQPTGIVGNNKKPGQTGNVFSSDLGAWYSVEILNNKTDSGYASGTDSDARVVIRATGYGPNGAVARLEWEVQASTSGTSGRPCATYGQRGLTEEGTGRNDCLGAVDSTNTATYRPGGS